MTIAKAVAVGEYLAAPDTNIGYSQDQTARRSLYADNGQSGVAGLREPADGDCSYSTAVAQVLGELAPPAVLKGTLYSGNYGAKLASGGTMLRINVRGKTLAEIKAMARPADAIYGPGHVMFHLGGGRWLSFESDERGRSIGGKPGRQKGEHIRVRSLYLRGASSRKAGSSRTGWVEIVRAKSPATFLGQVLAAYGAGKSGAAEAAQARLSRRAPFDGPRYAEFMAEWAALDKGAPCTYNAAGFAAAPDHAFIVLGGTRPQMRRRMAAGLPAILANPDSKVIVSGAPVRGGTTEAEYMRAWLVKNGVAAGRVLVEGKAGSTIGNALYSAQILIGQGLSSYTIVSDESHLRRAGILFRAALAKADAASNTRRQITATTAIAFDDYGAKPHLSSLPVAAKTRAEYAGYVATLLGLTAQYQTATN